jgi:hypothetical protein
MKKMKKKMMIKKIKKKKKKYMFVIGCYFMGPIYRVIELF